MMTAEQLKASILQLAMQGKLVEQRSEEGTGEKLLIRIRGEKKQLVEEGSVKKGKRYDDISVDEISFEIPETWAWARLADVVYNRGQKKPDQLFSYIDIGSIDNEHQLLNNDETIIEAKNAPSRARKIVELGDVIYSTVRPYLHNMCIIDREFSCEPIASTGFAVMTCHEGLYNKFLFYYLLSPDFDRYANDMENAKGVAYPAINDQKLYKALVPLPPLKEQKRIVAKIEELMPFVELYADASIKLNTLNASFPDMMKKSILREAVQGKLVPQDPNDEPACELLKRIAEEKQRLVREGKIKKQKALPEITEDEIPFEIPESWEWTRLNDCLDVRDGTHDSPKYHTEGYPLVTSKNLRGNGIDFSTCKLISQEDFEAINQRSKVDDGDILFAMIGTVGNPVLYHGEANFSIKNMALFKHIGDYLDMEYICWFLLFAQYDMKKKASGGVQSFVSLGFLRNYLIPIPPTEEQHRIVKRIKEIVGSIGELGKRMS